MPKENQHSWAPGKQLSGSRLHSSKITYISDFKVCKIFSPSFCATLSHHYMWIKTLLSAGRSQAGGGIGRGDHFLPYKLIERTIERWANFTKQLLIASREHQAPRKATHCLQREVGQNIKGDKRTRDGDPSQEGSPNRGSFQSPGNPRTGGSEGSFQISEGNLTGKKN